MRKSILAALAAALAFTLSFTACDDFFSSGWGSPREYSAGNINVTVNNLDRWLDRTVGNPPLARLVSENISAQVADPNHPHRQQFQQAGVRMAVESSGLGVALLNNALDIVSDMADASDDELEGMLRDVLSGVQRDFRNSGGSVAAENITSIVYGDIYLASGDVPTFNHGTFARYPNFATPSEVGQAILVLTLALVDEKEADFYDWDDFDIYDIGLNFYSGNVVVVGTTSPMLVVLAAYLNLIAHDANRFGDNFLTSAISEAFLSAGGSDSGGN
ncbi:MAG: hypothetical protein FWB99_06920 [Treponema sp.]|nr:hypothetical protein [Treponema sp.]